MLHRGQIIGKTKIRPLLAHIPKRASWACIRLWPGHNGARSTPGRGAKASNSLGIRGRLIILFRRMAPATSVGPQPFARTSTSKVARRPRDALSSSAHSSIWSPEPGAGRAPPCKARRSVDRRRAPCSSAAAAISRVDAPRLVVVRPGGASGVVRSLIAPSAGEDGLGDRWRSAAFCVRTARAAAQARAPTDSASAVRSARSCAHCRGPALGELPADRSRADRTANAGIRRRAGLRGCARGAHAEGRRAHRSPSHPRLPRVQSRWQRPNAAWADDDEPWHIDSRNSSRSRGTRRRRRSTLRRALQGGARPAPGSGLQMLRIRELDKASGATTRLWK